MSVTPEQVVSESRKYLLAYAKAINPNYQFAKHLIKIARVLQKLESGELKRVIITIPPRHGKSMLVSQYFPAWYLGRNPDKYLIAASYGQDLADDFGRKVRDQFKEPLYSKIFDGVQLKSGSTAASRFATMQGGEYFAVGAGAAITGRGAHGFLMDDPTKSREEAESQTIQRHLYDWYESTAYSRLMPGGWIAIIAQRWNDQDLVGYVLKHHAHENWTVINMAAINEEGQPLWPEMYDIPALNNIRQTVKEYNWASQYQQEPISRGTAVLDVTKISGYDTLPKMRAVFTACDPAISKNTKACNTAFCTVGVGVDGHVYDLETIADRWSFLETLRTMEGVLSRNKSQYVGVEDNGYQMALVEAAQQEFQHVQVVNLHADKDKFRRAKSISSIIDRGLFHTNNQQLLSEIVAFDPMVVGESKKDRVDAMVHALHMVQKYAPIDVIETNPHKEFEGLSSAQAWFKLTREHTRRLQSGNTDRVIEFNQSHVAVDPDFY